MAHRSMMAQFRDGRRDRLAVNRPQQPQHQGHVANTVASAAVAAAGFRPHQRFPGRKEDETGLMTTGGRGWVVAAAHEHHHQRLMAEAALSRQRASVRQQPQVMPPPQPPQLPQPPPPPPPPLPSGALIRPEWDGPAELRQQQQPSLAGLLREVEFSRGISRDAYAELRRADEREEILKGAVRPPLHMNDPFEDARMQNLRAYDQQQQQQADASIRDRGLRAARDESGHAELIARYGGGDQSSAKDLEKTPSAPSLVVQPLLPSRKRTRGEEAGFGGRERALRFRPLSALDGPALPPALPPPAPAMHTTALAGKEFGHPKIEYVPGPDVRVDEDDQEEGQLTPPPPHMISRQVPPDRGGFRKQPYQQRTIQDGPIPHSARADAPAKAHVSLDNGFPLLPPERENRRKVGPPRGFPLLPPERENRHQVGPPRGRARAQRSLSPRFKDNERRLLSRPERMRTPDESELPDLGKLRDYKELEKRSRVLNFKLPDRGGYEGFRSKRRQQDWEDDIPFGESKPHFDSRDMSMGPASLNGFLLERLAKERRAENDAKRKGSKVKLAKDSEMVREMTISVQKRGLRTVKVEEYNRRDVLPPHRLRTVNHIPSANEEERWVLPKWKDRERRAGTTSHDTVARPHHFNLTTTLPDHVPKVEERVSPFSRSGKSEFTAPIDHNRLEPHRNAALSRWPSDFRPEHVSISMRGTAADTFRRDDSIPPSHDDKPFPSSCRRSPNISAQTSPGPPAPDKALDVKYFPVASRPFIEVIGGRQSAHAGLVSSKRKISVVDSKINWQADLGDRMNTSSAKVQNDEEHLREDSNSQQLLRTERPGFCLDTTLHKEQGNEVLQLERNPPKLSAFKSESPDLHMDGTPSPPKTLQTSVAVLASDINSSAEVPSTGQKSQVKMISTGHKKDPSCKKRLVIVDKSSCGTSTLPMENPVSNEKSNRESSEAGDSTGEALVSGRMPALADREQASPKASYPDKNHKGTDKTAEAVLNAFQPANKVSSVSPCGPSGIWSENPNSKPDEKDRVAIARASGAATQPLPGVSEPRVDEAGSGVSGTSGPSSALSAQKEVRLFGANLNALVDGRVKLEPQESESVELGAGQTVLPTMDEISSPVRVAKSVDSTGVIEIGKDVSSLSLRQKPDETLMSRKAEERFSTAQTSTNFHVKAEEKLSILESTTKTHLPIARDITLPQVQANELFSLPEEQHLPSSQLSAVTPAVPMQLPNVAHAIAAHTWHRGTSNASQGSANISRGMSAFGRIQPAGSAKTTQMVSYVRKGNTLVRAPRPSNLHPPSDRNVIAMAGQGGQAPTVKFLSSKKSLTSKSSGLKSFYPAHSKYLAPSVESDVLASSGASGPASIFNNPTKSSELGIASVPVVLSHTVLPQATLTSSANGETLAAPLQEQQTGAVLVIDRSIDSLGETDVGRETRSETHGTFRIPPSGSQVKESFHRPVETRLYVRRRANQLVVAPVQAADLTYMETERLPAGRTGPAAGHYFKRKTNQLVRRISGKGSAVGNVGQNRGRGGLCPGTNLQVQRRGSSSVSKKTRLALRQMKGSAERSSWVWTLSGAAVGHARDFSTQSLRTGPLIPWKRQNSLRTPGRPQRLRTFPEGDKGSLLFLMRKRLGRVKPVQPVYTRSANGFSLHRSGVMNVRGGNLKWTKSLAKRAKQASEEATKAVAEAERRKRTGKDAVVDASMTRKDDIGATRNTTSGGGGERIVWVGLERYKMDASSKTLQRVPDVEGGGGDNDAISRWGWAKTSPILTPRRSIIGGTQYLRVGNGNQLVRDPKAASRAMANEKVRWSLHNARSRGAKKPQYCQFFTRFGKCNKETGKCLYIHDQEKVAVCTKFLNGNCKGDHCPLTHKVIPERMPDCSYFLEGLCTNEDCPYRHVCVNPKAPYCDGFLRGYCKDGDKCNKKHTYVCSVYVETGECSDQATCKFHHPRKKDKSFAQVSSRKAGTKCKRRYFSSLEEPGPIKQKVHWGDCGNNTTSVVDVDASKDASMEFISLSNIESDEDLKSPPKSQLPSWHRPGKLPPKPKEAAGSPDEMKTWIRPLFLSKLSSSPAAAAV